MSCPLPSLLQPSINFPCLNSNLFNEDCWQISRIHEGQSSDQDGPICVLYLYRETVKRVWRLHGRVEVKVTQSAGSELLTTARREQDTIN